MNMHDIDDYRWLVSSAGADVIHAASELLAVNDVVAVTSRLRKDLSPARTHLVIQQAQLRQRARDKFAAAERMLFTDVGLQQATGEIMADYKARRFSPGELVVDLCCGIGGDLFSLAARGPASGVDRDEVAVILADANCRALCLNDATVRCEDVTQLDIPATSLIHIDPDRRPQGRRTTNVASHEPGDAFLGRLIGNCRGGAIKLAPAAQAPSHWGEQCELEWISHRGECKQLVVWFGSLANNANRRAATMLSGDGTVYTMTADQQEAANAPPIAANIGRYVYEPDAAVIAARLVGALASRHELSATFTGIAYLTSDVLIVEPALSAFEVVDVLPLDVKKLKATLRERRIGRLEVKKRGVGVEPAELRRRLKCPGDEKATLIVTPHGGNVVAILARRMDKCRGSLRDPLS